MIFLSRRFRRLAPLLPLAALLAGGFSACSILGNGGGPAADRTLSIAAVFPTSGPEAGVGQAMRNAVDLAVAQNASLGDGYTLSVTNVDEANGFTDQAAQTLASNSLTMGIVGPQDSQDAVAMLPRIEASGNGGGIVRAYTDLKRHNLCDAQDHFFCNEQVAQSGIALNTFLTRKLWDVGSTTPYGHRGDLSTLTEAIEHHAGEGRPSRDQFMSLSTYGRASVIEFLKTLQILPAGSPLIVRELDLKRRSGM